MAPRKKVEKETKKKENSTPSPINIFTYEEYYDILMFAQKIRLENENLINNAKGPKEKLQLLEVLFKKYNVSVPKNSDKEDDKENLTPKDKELLSLLKINIFIPDYKKFERDYHAHSKNVRLISEDYQIPAPFVIQKLFEIGKFASYLERLEKEGGLQQPTLSNKKDLANSPKPVTNLESENSNIQLPIKDEIIFPQSSIEESILLAPSSTTNTAAQATSIPTSKSNLQSQFQSLEAYCLSLLAAKEQISNENSNLIERIKSLEKIIENLQMGKKVEIPIYASSSQTENDLRRQLKELRCENEELKTNLNVQENRTKTYQQRAIIAEVQLEQLRDNMSSIVHEVDSLDLDIATEKNIKQQ